MTSSASVATTLAVPLPEMAAFTVLLGNFYGPLTDRKNGTICDRDRSSAFDIFRQQRDRRHWLDQIIDGRLLVEYLHVSRSRLAQSSLECNPPLFGLLEP